MRRSCEPWLVRHQYNRVLFLNLTWLIVPDALLGLPCVELDPQELHWNPGIRAIDELLLVVLQELAHDPCVGVEIINSLSEVLDSVDDRLNSALHTPLTEVCQQGLQPPFTRARRSKICSTRQGIHTCLEIIVESCVTLSWMMSVSKSWEHLSLCKVLSNGRWLGKRNPRAACNKQSESGL